MELPEATRRDAVYTADLLARVWGVIEATERRRELVRGGASIRVGKAKHLPLMTVAYCNAEIDRLVSYGMRLIDDFEARHGPEALAAMLEIRPNPRPPPVIEPTERTGPYPVDSGVLNGGASHEECGGAGCRDCSGTGMRTVSRQYLENVFNETQRERR